MTLHEVAGWIQKELGLSIVPQITIPEVEAFGHYSTNVAFVLAKEKKVNPFDLAQEFAKRLSGVGDNALFSRIEAVRPGFINFWIAPAYLQRSLLSLYKNPKKIGRQSVGKNKTIIIEYSAPNIAKPMHVGHLRSTVIGDALANLYESLGYRVVRWNYLGDWGTQFGKLIAAYKLWGSKAVVSKNPIPELLKLYVRFHAEMKTSPELEERGRQEFAKLEKGDAENRRLWRWFRKVSVAEFKKTYKRLGVRFDIWRGESHYEKELEGLVRALLLLGGDFVKRSEGALIFPLDKFSLPPALLQKADGASLYLTRDIASLKKRIKEYKPEKILYVVGNEQALHFDQLFTIAKLLKLGEVDLAHIKYGLVLGPDGKKLSTREGKAITLASLLDEAVKRVRAVINEKNPDLKEKEKERIAEAVGVSVVKYNDLKEHRQSDIRFNWEEMLNTRGDSAPYLQYTFARLKGILKKGGRPRAVDGKALTEALDLALIKKVNDLDVALALCAQTNTTSQLAKYLYELASLANQFYEKIPVLKDEQVTRRTARLALISVVAETLRCGLAILGITTNERI